MLAIYSFFQIFDKQSSEAGNLRDKGAEYTGDDVTRDGKLITANGPGAAAEFGAKIAEACNNSTH